MANNRIEPIKNGGKKFDICGFCKKLALLWDCKHIDHFKDLFGFIAYAGIICAFVYTSIDLATVVVNKSVITNAHAWIVGMMLCATMVLMILWTWLRNNFNHQRANLRIKAAANFGDNGASIEIERNDKADDLNKSNKMNN